MPSPAWHRRWVRLGDLGDLAWQWWITVLLALLVAATSVGLTSGVLWLLLQMWRDLR